MEVVILERGAKRQAPPGKGSDKSFFDHTPLLALGFRPFYLLAAAFAAVSVPLWLIRYFGMGASLTHVDLNWHMHEMIFGFIIAVVIGFLYTAARNWTGLPTPHGKQLAALAGVWVAGRAAMLFAPVPYAALVDIAFLPLVAWPLYRVFKLSGNKRNMFLIGLLSLLTVANAAYHGAVLGWLPISSIKPLYAALMVIVVIESVIAGRVLPLFTANGVPGVKPVTNMKRDKISLALTAVAAVAWVCSFPAPLAAALAFAAAFAQMTRLLGWKPHRTLGNPLLWVLHLAYAWIPIGFLFLGLAALGLVPSSAGIHLLAIGSMAGLIIGMMTRTALGHTGRMLRAGKAETIMYASLQIGVVSRLVAALSAGEVRNLALLATGLAWTLSFVLYVAVYAPYLVRARVDGKEG